MKKENNEENNNGIIMETFALATSRLSQHNFYSL